MWLKQLNQWLRSILPQRSGRGRCRQVRARASTRLNLEQLEDRAVPAVLMVTSLSDSTNATAGDGTLRGEILAAQNNDTIQFSSNLAGAQLNLATTLTLNTSLTISGSGSGVTLSGLNRFEDFLIDQGATVNLNDLTIANGVGGKNDNGGGIYNSGTLTVTNCNFTNNVAQCGAGIYNVGTLTATACTFATGDTQGIVIAAEGSGIFNDGGLQVTDCTFANNSAGYGGGLYNAESDQLVSVSDSTFANNSLSDAVAPPAAAFATTGVFWSPTVPSLTTGPAMAPAEASPTPASWCCSTAPWPTTSRAALATPARSSCRGRLLLTTPRAISTTPAACSTAASAT